MFLRKAAGDFDLTRGMLSFLRCFSRLLKRLGRWCARRAGFTHLLFATRSYSVALGVNVGIESGLHGYTFLGKNLPLLGWCANGFTMVG